MTIEYVSQIGQDQYYIEQFSKGARGGRFLDVGAHDGVTTSNTLVLERDFGWTGVCVEANGDLIPTLIDNRPKSQVHEAVVWNYRTKTKFELPSNGDTLLSRIGNQEVNKYYFVEEFQEVQTRIVRTKRLRDILGPGRHWFDFFSLDVEGAEINALKGIDWASTRFGFIAVEFGDRADYLNELIGYLFARGYYVHRIHRFDAFFVPRGRPRV
jgi:FkbM family methyltransferase